MRPFKFKDRIVASSRTSPLPDGYKLRWLGRLSCKKGHLSWDGVEFGIVLNMGQGKRWSARLITESVQETKIFDKRDIAIYYLMKKAKVK